MTSNTSEPGPEKSAASGSAYPECQDCETTINAQISRISNSVQRLEGLITKAIEALSLDVDLEDLETSHHEDNNAKGKEPMSNYGLYSEFWYTMGPGAEYSDVTRIHYEFLDFFCAENGTTLRPKECERSGSSPRRYINGTLARDDMSNEEVLALIKNAWPNHSVGFGKVEDLHSFASENCPAVQVQTVRYDETGFVRWAWGDESAFALFWYCSFRPFLARPTYQVSNADFQFDTTYPAKYPSANFGIRAVFSAPWYWPCAPWRLRTIKEW